MPALPASFNSLIIGASGGIGAALAAALHPRPVTGVSRHSTPPLVLEDESSIAAAAAALGPCGPFHLIIDATGALVIDGAKPEKRLADLDPAIMARAFAINAIGPALLVKHFSALLPREGPCVFATLSARVGSISDNQLGGWYSYRASKAALNQFWRTAAIEIARKRPDAVLLALQPGTVRTKLSAAFTSADQGISPEESAAGLLKTMFAATETGVFLDHAGNIVPW